MLMENLALKDIELDEYLKTVGGACIENDVRIQEVEIDKNSSDFSDADLSDISLPDVEISKPKTGNDLRQHRKKSEARQKKEKSGQRDKKTIDHRGHKMLQFIISRFKFLQLNVHNNHLHNNGIQATEAKSCDF